MEPLIISKSDYESGNYPKGVPIMIGMSVDMDGASEMSTGKKITIKVKAS